MVQLKKMQQTTREPRREAGFTLLEVMIALVVLAFGLLAVASAQIHAMRGGRSGRHTTFAVALAQTQMEQLQRSSWTTLLPTGGWSPGVPMGNTVDAAVAQIEQNYTLSWQIADVVPNVVRTLDVRVNWNEPNRPGRSFTISSARYNHEGL